MAINKAFLLTGGNMGDRQQLLEHARKSIGDRCGRVVAASGTYETAAWGKTDQPAFLNQALDIETTLSPQALLQQLLFIEQELGRVRQEKFGPRLIDIDILFYNDLVIHTNTLTIPHPQMQHRRFVLQPLAEIAPEQVHPVLHLTVAELLRRSTDPLEVRKAP